jgi:aryl carrier-like protein
VGRKDHQAKLRGQRLELSEVENHLFDCFPNVREAIAEVIELDGQSTPSLVAFICQEEGRASGSTSDLFCVPNDTMHRDVLMAEAKLRLTVPSFMIPSLFIPVTHMPQAGNGKIDRYLPRATVATCPATQLQHYRVGVAANRAPSTPLERKLRLIWAAALRVEPETVGADDQFFHLGGNSIAAMNMVARLQDCGLQLTVANIFSHPRLADQALLLNPVSKSEVGDFPAPCASGR